MSAMGAAGGDASACTYTQRAGGVLSRGHSGALHALLSAYALMRAVLDGSTDGRGDADEWVSVLESPREASKGSYLRKKGKLEAP